MLEAVAFTYSLLATYVLCSAERNHRRQTRHARPLLNAGWLLMSMSFALSALLFGVAAWKYLTA